MAIILGELDIWPQIPMLWWVFVRLSQNIVKDKMVDAGCVFDTVLYFPLLYE